MNFYVLNTKLSQNYSQNLFCDRFYEDFASKTLIWMVPINL